LWKKSHFKNSISHSFTLAGYILWLFSYGNNSSSISFLSFPAEQQNSSCHQKYACCKDPVFRSKVLQHTKGIQFSQIFISCACGCNIIAQRDHISHNQVIGDCVGKDAESSECHDFRHCTEEIPADLHLTIPGMHHTDVDEDKK